MNAWLLLAVIFLVAILLIVFYVLYVAFDDPAIRELMAERRHVRHTAKHADCTFCRRNREGN